MMDECLLTVAIFTYNHEKYIERTINSVLSQKTSFKFNIMVIDDCSIDKSIEIIDSIADTDSRILKAYNEHNLGANESFIYNISKIKTKYIASLGGDDYWVDNDKLEKQVSLLENNKDISCVLTGFQKYYEESNSYDAPQTYWQWRMPKDRINRIISVFNDDWSYYPLGSTLCYRTNIIQMGLKEHIAFIRNPWVGEGTFINTTLCLFGDRIVCIPEVTTIYTIRQNSLSHSIDNDALFKFKQGFLETKLFVCDELNIPNWRRRKFSFRELSLLLDMAYRNNQFGMYTLMIEKVNIPTGLRILFSCLLRHRLLYHGFKLGGIFKRKVVHNIKRVVHLVK